MDLPTPVPASMALCVEVPKASRTSWAIATCSGLDSKSWYMRDTTPSLANAASISSREGRS